MIITSLDGDNWVQQKFRWLATLASVAFGDNRFMITSADSGGLVATSFDVKAWHEIANPSSSKVQLLYAGGHFICTTRSGRPQFYRDNSHWEPEPFKVSKDFIPQQDLILSVTHGRELFVAVGNQIETSKDGVTWYRQHTPRSKLLWGFIWKQDGSFTPSPVGLISSRHTAAGTPFNLTSTNGVTWRTRYSVPISGMVHGNVRVYSFAHKIGETAALTSDDGVNWTRLKPVAESHPRPLPTIPSKLVEVEPSASSPSTNDVVLIHLNGSGYQLVMPQGAGPVYWMQASTDLVHWVELGLLTNTTGVLNFVDRDASQYPTRFYRLRVP